jgi:hypothetical protein
LAPKREFEHDVKLDVEARVRQGVKAILEEVLEEEMTQHLQAGSRGCCGRSSSLMNCLLLLPAYG